MNRAIEDDMAHAAWRFTTEVKSSIIAPSLTNARVMRNSQQFHGQ